MISWKRPTEWPSRGRRFLTQAVPRPFCRCLCCLRLMALLQVYVLRVDFNDLLLLRLLLLLLIASFGSLMRCHRLLLLRQSFHQHWSRVPNYCQLQCTPFLLLLLPTPYEQWLLLYPSSYFLIGFLVVVCCCARFEIVPLIGHVWCVQEARGHRFALLDRLLITAMVGVVHHTIRLSCHVFVQDKDLFDITPFTFDCDELSGFVWGGNFLSVLFLNLIRFFLLRAVFIVKTVFKTICCTILHYHRRLLVLRWLFLILLFKINTSSEYLLFVLFVTPFNSR